MASTPVDLYSEGEENASRGLFQLLVSPSVVAPLGQKNVPTAARQSPKGSSRELKCSEVRKRLGDFMPTTGRRGGRQITEGFSIERRGSKKRGGPRGVKKKEVRYAKTRKE